MKEVPQNTTPDLYMRDQRGSTVGTLSVKQGTRVDCVRMPRKWNLLMNLPILRPCLFCSGKTQGRKRRMGSRRNRKERGTIRYSLRTTGKKNARQKEGNEPRRIGLFLFCSTLVRTIEWRD